MRRGPLMFVVMALSLGFAPGASAATFCTHGWPGCADTHPNVQAAVDAASATPGTRDRVQVGPGTHSEAVTVGASNPLDLVGRGRATTALSGTGSPVLLTAADTRVFDLGVRLREPNQSGIENSGELRRVAVTQGSSANAGLVGVQLENDGGVFQSTVGLRSGTGTNIALRASGPGERTIEDSTLDADFRGLLEQGENGSTTTVRRAAVTADQGAVSRRGELRLENVLVRVRSLPTGQSNGVVADPEGPDTASVKLRHGTVITSSSTYQGVGARANGAGEAAFLNFRDTIVAGPAQYHLASDLSGGTMSSVSAEGSNYDPDRVGSTGSEGGTLIWDGPGDTSAEPRFAGSSDYHLRWDSPLVDAGGEGLLGPSSDLAKLPRVVNGAGGGPARRDMGAFEYQRRPPWAIAHAAGSAPLDREVTFDGRRSGDADAGDTLRYTWRFDDGATAAGPVVRHGFGSVGGHRATLTVTDPTGLARSTSRWVRVGSTRRCSNLRSGGPERDSLTGTPFGDRLTGGGGNDRLRGVGGSDCLEGGRGGDRLLGDSGNDRLSGGADGDRLGGGSGNDRIRVGGGQNRASGGPGRDSIDARNRRRDRVDCGSGRDTVRADRRDRLRRCERVRRR